MYTLLCCWGSERTTYLSSLATSSLLLSYFIVAPFSWDLRRASASLAFCTAVLLKNNDRSSVTTFRPPCRLTCGGSICAPGLALSSEFDAGDSS